MQSRQILLGQKSTKGSEFVDMGQGSSGTQSDQRSKHHRTEEKQLPKKCTEQGDD